MSMLAFSTQRRKLVVDRPDSNKSGAFAKCLFKCFMPYVTRKGEDNLKMFTLAKKARV